MNLDANLKQYLILSHFPAIGPAAFRKIIAYFGSLDNFWQAKHLDWRKAGLNEETIRKFLAFIKDFGAERLIELTKILEREHIELLPFNSPLYPAILKEIPTPPALLYYQGNIKALSVPSLAVVGSRQNTPYGTSALHYLLPSVIDKGVTIISGLALGTDTIAHQLAVQNGGPTIAILGGGLDAASFYPAVNRQLGQDIINRGGLLISEFPPLCRPSRFSFPQRNRLIAALSRATLVVEAAQKSGALITADYALDFNREVLAIPGSIFSDRSQGTNQLLKSGARLINTAEDILLSLSYE